MDTLVADLHVATAQSPAVGVGGEQTACSNHSSDLAEMDSIVVAKSPAGGVGGADTSYPNQSSELAGLEGIADADHAGGLRQEETSCTDRSIDSAGIEEHTTVRSYVVVSRHMA